MTDLAEFFRKKKEAVAQLESRREQVLEDWLKALNNLYDKLDRWLKPAVSEGLKVRRYQKEIIEYELGTYQAPALEISFGLRTVHFEPVARFIVGGAGRVDVNSPRGIFKLIRDPDTQEWLLVRRTLADAEPLNKNSFETLIKEIFRDSDDIAR
uniref:Hypothetical conserved protein n=2 Tax=Candidatus Bipolaricaulota TaxID=67810 RepID=H5SKG4_9BACT|nr:hypothetical conserved protein [uncultured Acetothermia bacterium]BAL56851.1 hypothetical conserved protein [uncultured Acetothermia bacterium]BAL59319.1 hypothetical conserved protein [Candidatus Acetothermum autotrophicum]